MGLVSAYMIEKGALGGADAIFGMHIAFTITTMLMIIFKKTKIKGKASLC